MAEAALNPSTISALGGHSQAAAPAKPRKLPPGKVAMWLFLGTEVMFFTGLIGSYIVLRLGSPPTAYSSVYPPNGAPAASKARLNDPDIAFTSWPRPFDPTTNPLNVPMTFVNTLILAGSSVTLSFGLAAIKKGQQLAFRLLLLATLVLGSIFLGVQVVEYKELLFPHEPFPIGVSETGRFTPGVSLFASCFFTMTGFHGAHVAAGVITLLALTIAAFMGRFSPKNHAAVEYAGLYWHFVDLVWAVLFVVVYLV